MQHANHNSQSRERERETSRRVTKAKQLGFTLIELLVVIAIIGTLATLVILQLGKARGKARDAKRIHDLKQMQTALALYYDDNAAYPINPAYPSWNASEPGNTANPYSANYVPGIAPQYMPNLPRDPRGGPGHDTSGTTGVCGPGYLESYLYLSDGTNYKFVSNCAPEHPLATTNPFYDPVRTNWAWMICSGPPACTVW
jgi:prepilin-type N-terminal cleavage/methylation domain-containing protein